MIEYSFWPGPAAAALLLSSHQTRKRPALWRVLGLDFKSLRAADRARRRSRAPLFATSTATSQEYGKWAIRSDFKPRCLLCRPSGVRVGRAIHPITPLDLGLFTVRRAAG